VSLPFFSQYNRIPIISRVEAIAVPRRTAPDAELLRPDYDDLRTLTQGQATDYENSCHWPFRKRPDNA